MKKISQFVEKSGQKILIASSILRLVPATRLVFAERGSALNALFGLTLVEAQNLRYLLLQCIKNYHTQHPAEFSLSLLIDLEEVAGQTIDTLLSQSSNGGAQSTGIY